MYLFELVADDLCGPVAYSGAISAVARICLVGSAGWPGLAPRAAGVTGFVGEAIGRAACVCRFDGLGFRCWVGGGVRQGWRRLGVTSRRGWRRWGLAPFRRGVQGPGRRGGWAMSVVQTTAPDPNFGMSVAVRRSRAAGGTSGAGVRAADPAAAVGQAWPGLLVLVRAHRARAARASASGCPVTGPGVMMAWVTNTSQCGGCRGGADRCRVVETRLL